MTKQEVLNRLLDLIIDIDKDNVSDMKMALLGDRIKSMVLEIDHAF